MSNEANGSVGSTPVPAATASVSRRLPIITLIVAGAAAVLSVFAIATDDVAAPSVSVAVQQPAAQQSGGQQPATPGSIARVAVHTNVDGCGRPIVRGQNSCW